MQLNCSGLEAESLTGQSLCNLHTNCITVATLRYSFYAANLINGGRNTKL